MLQWLRAWVGVVAVMALGSAVQCFLNAQYPQQRIYILQPSEATPLLSRMFGVWTLLAAVVRFAFAANPYNKSLFVVTFLSFLLAFGHFASEVFIYGTADLSFGSIAPLLVSGISALWMSFVWPLLDGSDSTAKGKRN